VYGKREFRSLLVGPGTSEGRITMSVRALLIAGLLVAIGASTLAQSRAVGVAVVGETTHLLHAVGSARPLTSPS
jgi:hypothetical protein